MVWETDVTCQTSTRVMDGASLLGAGTPPFFNGMAFNASSTTGGSMFWINSDGALVAWVRASGAYGIVATPAQLQSKAGGNPANGAWYLDSYWFVETANPPKLATQATLYRVAFYVSSTYGTLPTFAGLSSYTLALSPGVRVGFGDIAFTTAGGNGVLYLAPASVDGIPANPMAPMYVVNNVNAMIAAGSATATELRHTGVDTKQLSFDKAGTTLWAHDHNTCRWGTVDTATGAVTDVFQGPACLRDIGGAAAPCTCSPTGNSYIYGIADNKILYEVDVTGKTTTPVFNAAPVRSRGVGVGVGWGGVAEFAWLSLVAIQERTKRARLTRAPVYSRPWRTPAPAATVVVGALATPSGFAHPSLPRLLPSPSTLATRPPEPPT